MRFNEIIQNALTEASMTHQNLADELRVGRNAVTQTIMRPNITLAKFITIMDILGYEVIVRNDNTEIRVTNK